MLRRDAVLANGRELRSPFTSGCSAGPCADPHASPCREAWTVARCRRRLHARSARCLRRACFDQKSNAFRLQGILAMNQTTDVERVAAAVSAAIHEHWALFLVEGILLTVLGMLAILLPAFASLASALVGLVAGGLLLAQPVQGTLSLTAVLIAFLIAEGVVSIFYATEHRKGFSAGWGWMLVSGLLDLVLAVILLAGLPGTAVWALGVLLGVNMIVGGAALLSMSLQARSPAQ